MWCSASAILKHKEHRPYDYPGKPWVMSMRWDDLLFMHYPFPAEDVQKLLPAQFVVDTFNGAAWIGVVPFKMSAVRPRLLPNLPMLSFFLELNVRTYVSVDGISGVYFFSLDASNVIAVEAARLGFHLPYFFAQMQVKDERAGFIYRSTRLDKRGSAARLDMRYKPAGPAFKSQRGSLEDFLTERYCLYTTYGEDVLRCHVHHNQWQLQPAEADIACNTMLDQLSLAPGAEPHLLFSKSLQTVAWAPDLVQPD